MNSENSSIKTIKISEECHVSICDRRICTLEFRDLYINLLVSMSAIRQKEFLDGRYLLHKISSVENHKFNINDNNAPCFPNNLYGSLSHSESHVACIMSNINCYIGVDIENIFCFEVFEDIKLKIYTKNEIESIARATNPLKLATIIFSAKESFYKAYTVFQDQITDFKEIQVIVDNDTDIKIQYLRSLYKGSYINLYNKIIVTYFYTVL